MSKNAKSLDKRHVATQRYVTRKELKELIFLGFMGVLFIVAVMFVIHDITRHNESSIPQGYEEVCVEWDEQQNINKNYLTDCCFEVKDKGNEFHVYREDFNYTFTTKHQLMNSGRVESFEDFGRICLKYTSLDTIGMQINNRYFDERTLQYCRFEELLYIETVCKTYELRRVVE